MSDKARHIGGNPTGMIGTLAGYLMNTIHARLYAETVRKIAGEIRQSGEPPAILDAGCGGGKAVQLFCRHVDGCKVWGIDHSSEMVRLARRTGRKYVDAQRAEIVRGDISRLPFPSLMFDLVSAFDTINLWTDPDASTAEVHRVLKPDGLFVVVNGYPEVGSRWCHMVRFKSEEEYRVFLENHGFAVERVDIARRVMMLLCRKS